VGLKEAQPLRLEDRNGTLVPENVVRPAELFRLGHLGRENGNGGGVIHAAPDKETLAAGRQSGGDQQVAVLPEVERVFEQERDVRHEQGRAQFAGGGQRFKTFLADPRVDDRLELGAGSGIGENPATQRGPIDRARGVDDRDPETGGDGGTHLAGCRQQSVDTGVGIENHRVATEPREDATSRGLAAGNAAAETENKHATSLAGALGGDQPPNPQ